MTCRCGGGVHECGRIVTTILSPIVVASLLYVPFDTPVLRYPHATACSVPFLKLTAT
jgi:hypothetical protein